MGLKPLDDCIGIKTKTLTEGKTKNNIKSVDDTMGGAANEKKIKEVVANFLVE